MSAGFGTALVAVIVFIGFIVIVAFILPHSYNQNLKTEQTLTNYCTELKKSIDTDKPNTALTNLTIVEIQTYSQNCAK